MPRLPLLVLSAVLLFSCARTPEYPRARFDSGGVKIPLGEIQDEKPTFYTFDGDRKKINYFVMLHDGDVEAYLDACAKCFPRKLGYHLEGIRIYCRACDVSYAVDELKHGVGSCYPVRIKGRVEGGEYVIAREEILKGQKFF